MLGQLEPSEQGAKEKKRRFILILVGAVATLWVAGALWNFAKLPQEPRKSALVFPTVRTTNAVAPVARVGTFDARQLMRTEARNSGLYQAPAPPPTPIEDAMSLDQFMGLLEQQVPKAAAEKVTKEFMKEPQLKTAWTYYRKNRGPNAKAKEFVNFLSRLPKFKEMAQKFKNDAGVSKAFADVMKSADTGRVVKAGLGNYSGAQAVDQAEIARQWAAKAHASGDYHARAQGAGGAGQGIGLTGGFGGARSAGPVGGANLYGAEGAGSAIAGVGQSGPSAGPRAANLGGGGAPDGSNSGGSSSGQSNVGLGGQDAGQGGYNVPKGLVKPKSAGPDDLTKDGKFDNNKMITALLKWFANHPEYAAQKASIENFIGNGESAWGACWMANAYNVCSQACNDPTTTGVCSSVPSQYASCMEDGNRSAVGCVTECMGRSGCSINDQTYQAACQWAQQNEGKPPDCNTAQNNWPAACKNAALAQGQCDTNYAWGPPQTLADGSQYQPMGSLEGSVPPTQIAGPTTTGNTTGTSAAPITSGCTDPDPIKCAFTQATGGCNPDIACCIDTSGTGTGTGTGSGSGTGSGAGSGSPDVPNPQNAGVSDPYNWGDTAGIVVGCVATYCNPVITGVSQRVGHEAAKIVDKAVVGGLQAVGCKNPHWGWPPC